MKSIAPNVYHLPELATSVFDLLREYTGIFVLTDENTRQHCYPLVQDLLPRHTCFTVPAGEAYKTLDTCQKIWLEMTRQQLDRKAVCLNLGGGVIGDMGGFCAATYKRGIDFLQMPTTLLSQVDASVGGKLGIDFHGLKNHLGVFQQPQRVYIFSGFLQTLPAREIRSGFAEVLKHGLIASKSHWQKAVAATSPGQPWAETIPESVNIKAEVVRQDPTEKGLRKILNFGHTIGHAIESYFLEKGEERLLHGEAIAIGMICESWVSQQKGLITAADCQQIQNHLLRFFPKQPLPENADGQLLKTIYQDKKNTGKKINCTLLKAVGEAVFDQPVTAEEITKSLRMYSQL